MNVDFRIMAAHYSIQRAKGDWKGCDRVYDKRPSFTGRLLSWYTEEEYVWLTFNWDVGFQSSVRNDLTEQLVWLPLLSDPVCPERGLLGMLQREAKVHISHADLVGCQSSGKTFTGTSVEEVIVQAVVYEKTRELWDGQKKEWIPESLEHP
jgi:hypothetical protein